MIPLLHNEFINQNNWLTRQPCSELSETATTIDFGCTLQMMVVARENNVVVHN
jgi:hypothetical protein